ncbi:PhzF family phenazine biosynthesis protein [Tibeticola sp.]|uniref:PhzF family phenazine biosynthesis protein n=1 Tax=Tibeticola sp. TaxID=2005368 RepID=UPI00258C46AD|nr:PhzF family phenazine biosynthesis protein [Tibeticola sp.]MCI4440161.1 PhzF family phenazine biosynthesis protein [Tibeticola sp.]
MNPPSPTPRGRPFRQVDVFTKTPYFGNPVAVVLDGEGLDAQAMQRFARWTNLSETTFVLPPSAAARAAGADYRVRIYTPGGELPFAGHPTLGTCHAWLEAGGQPQSAAAVVQECGVGLVRIRRQGRLLAFAAPPLQRRDATADEIEPVRAALGLAPVQILASQMLDNGPVWLALLLDGPETVHALQPDHTALAKIGFNVGVAGVNRPDDAIALIARSSREARAFAAPASAGQRPAIHRTEPEPELIVRAFAAPIGVPEDPVTGSLNASLAQWLIDTGRMPAAYVAEQGAALGRAGRVHLERDASGQVWVGGHSVTCIAGEQWG